MTKAGTARGFEVIDVDDVAGEALVMERREDGNGCTFLVTYDAEAPDEWARAGGHREALIHFGEAFIVIGGERERISLPGGLEVEDAITTAIADELHERGQRSAA